MKSAPASSGPRMSASSRRKSAARIEAPTSGRRGGLRKASLIADCMGAAPPQASRIGRRLRPPLPPRRLRETPMPTTEDDIAQLRNRLKRAGQEHVLRFWEKLSADDRAALRAQIEHIDLDRLPHLIDRYVRSKPEPDDLDRLEPGPVYPRDAANPEKPWDPE